MQQSKMTRSVNLCFVFLVFAIFACKVSATPSAKVRKTIRKINNHGHYLGIVVPNAFEMDPLLKSSWFHLDNNNPTIDFSGRRFHVGKIHGERVIIAMSGLGMLNSGLSTQLLLSFFRIKGIIHYGIAGNANPSLHVGDVTIPRSWAHTGLWNWQRYGQGPNDELSLEVNGDYTRRLGDLHFGDYTAMNEASKRSLNTSHNLLNSVWYQPEEVFSVRGTPEVRDHHFWIPVDSKYYKIAKSLQDMLFDSSFLKEPIIYKDWKPSRCLNTTTCLSHVPKTVMVERGCSANVFVDNAAYRTFLFNKFNVTAIDMESAAVGLVCLAQRVPYIAIRALSDLAGGSSESNEAVVFGGLASQNAANAVVQFIRHMAMHKDNN